MAREIPALFEDAVLAEAGSRLVRVGETFAASGDELEMAVVRYGEHRVYLKSLAGGLLCIVVAGPVNMPALRMAANLVARRIGPAVARVRNDPPPPRPTSPTLNEPPPVRATPTVPAARDPGLPRACGASGGARSSSAPATGAQGVSTSRRASRKKLVASSCTRLVQVIERPSPNS